MDTFRKWLNKPKADDKSLLARFYHADRSLTAVASELDSFDGRAEPDRCSRLVNRLRQNQDKVLAITNLIMEELLGEDRDPRSFRAKFPEEVLQENLAGQLWFGAECLAAGSSIINREQESKEMRPLAQAVTKSLGNVRNLLRDQCLRNNVPNSRTLHLDLNDSSTEQLCESLKIFDRLFAEFELRYVSAMVQVKTKHEYEMQQMICVLFSETLQRALKTRLLDQEMVDAFDPALMFSIPRLAIIAGLVIYHKGPLNMDMPADQLSEMFRPFRTILIKIRDLLRTLNKNELYQLERLLCTNEDIHLKVQVGGSSIEAPNSDQQNNNNSNNCDETTSSGGGGGPSNDDNESTARPTTTARRQDNNNSSALATEPSTSPKKVLKTQNGGIPPREIGSRRTAAYTMRHLTCSSVSSVSANSSAASTPSVSPSASPTPSHSIASTSSAVSTSTTSPADWTEGEDEDEDDDDYAEELDMDVLPSESDIVSNDCISGFLIPNTNFGNLLQPQEVPLTDNFIASEDEFASNDNDVDDVDRDRDSNDLATTSTALLLSAAHADHQIHRNTDSSEDSEQLTIKASTKSLESCDTISNGQYGRVEKSCTSGVSKSDSASSSGSCSCSSSSCRQHRHHHHRQDHKANDASSGSSGSSALGRRHHHHHHHTHAHPHPHPHRHHHHHHHHHRHHHSKSKRSSLEGGEGGSEEHTDASSATTATIRTTSTSWSSKVTKSMHDTSSPDSSTSSSPSDGDPHEVSLALRAAGRLKFKSTENLLHRLFVCIAGVADQLQTNFAYDLRQILRSVFLMNMSLAQDDIIDIPEKTKDSELFEFRASENDVIQESAGSNQSIYSAEEVNPELDNVFNNSGSSSNGGRRSTGSTGSGSTGIQRVNTIDLGTTGGGDPTATSNTRSHIGRTRSLGEQDSNGLTTSSTSTSNNRQLSSYISGRRLSSPQRQQSTHHQLHRHRNRNNSVGSNSPTNSSTSSSSSAASSSSESNSPVSERVSAAGYSMSPRQQQQHLNAGAHSAVTAISNSNSINNNSMPDVAANPVSQAQSPPNARLAPPAWIPDDKAPRCMSCHTPFTAFRRRHHCRNCGGVFCGVCSNSSAPLPKYGLTKAVRVCRECYVREVRGKTVTVSGSVSSARSNASQRAPPLSSSAAAAATAGGS